MTYEARLAHVAQLVMDGRVPLPDALVVTMEARLPVPKSWSQKKRDAALCGALLPTGKPDGDNYAKMLDSLNQIVWVDDAQIVDLRIRKFYSARPGMKIEVRIADIFA
jgi:Holliday junction resolvase RusA-like endonuclease